MKRRIARVSFIGLLTLLLLCTRMAHAHEVYVLDRAEIATDLVQPPLDLWSAAMAQEQQFIIWGLIGVLLVVCILGISLSRFMERKLDPILFRIKPYAAHLGQITIGLALLASAHYGALFGLELPLSQVFGPHAALASIGLYASGALILLGIFPRVGAWIAVTIFIWGALAVGTYLTSYLTYVGEAVVIALFGSGYMLTGRLRLSHAKNAFLAGLQKRKHFLVRICFSASLIYAAVYAKLIHGALALDTVQKYHLTNYFHFDPHFVVLGAFLVEMTIALFYLVGFELRFTSLFFLIFLSMSLVFFGEAVWPHLILIGTAITMFTHGYDEYTIEHHWYKKGKREPVL